MWAPSGDPFGLIHPTPGRNGEIAPLRQTSIPFESLKYSPSPDHTVMLPLAGLELLSTLPSADKIHKKLVMPFCAIEMEWPSGE